MELAMQLISNDRTVRNDTIIEDLKRIQLTESINSSQKRRTTCFYDACF